MEIITCDEKKSRLLTSFTENSRLLRGRKAQGPNMVLEQSYRTKGTISVSGKPRGGADAGMTGPGCKAMAGAPVTVPEYNQADLVPKGKPPDVLAEIAAVKRNEPGWYHEAHALVPRKKSWG